MLAALALVPAADRWWAARQGRLGAVSLVAAVDAPAVVRAERLGPLLASWQTVGGCGAGASSGTGAGLKWIGRNVSGGFFHTELQGNYIKTDYGYNYIATTLITKDLGQRWNVGIAIPYLYKYMNDPYGLNFDVANKGLGDISGLVGFRFGAINDYTLTFSIGAPTGVYKATLIRSAINQLRQDVQMGAGKITGSLTLDHTIDNIWGPTVVGGIVNWRGGENSEHSFRAPAASLYGYMSYLLGPFAPAVGLSMTAFSKHDRNQGELQITPIFNVAGQVSLEWSTDWVAVLLGAVLPFQYDGEKTINDKPHNAWGFGSWIVALGIAVAPF